MKMKPRILLAVALILTSSPWWPLQAQTQEKRLALVIGNANYQKGALPTPANDAGLVAQTLQAAGFDVVGARDLDAETLRRSLHDFIQKVQTSGPDTVVFVYLAGYGMQLTGENYFAPIDANIGRDTDVPVEALRISDYTRQLSALPLKAGVIVLDAARSNPFAKEGQPLAGGLALVEPEPKMLIAFNAAPGTVGSEGAPPYGAYAQALAEMIRAGGLPLPDIFDRVRLRVNEMTKGAQIPWNAQKIGARFVFFERAPDAPTSAAPKQTSALRTKPIRDFDAKDAFIAALERDTLQDYESFLAAYPNDPLANRVRAIVAARREAITWRRTYRTDTPPAYWSYLERYPRGPHAADARRRLAILSAALEPPPTFAPIVYDVPPPPPEEIVYIDRPVLYFSDPVFAFAPPPPPPVFFLPPPPPDFVVLAPPPPPTGVFVLPTPLFVAMPAYVTSPAYVAPPPNNIIFANIHNTTVINNVINKTVVNNVASPNGPANQATNPVSAAASLPSAAAQKANLIQTPPAAHFGNAPGQASLPNAQMQPALAGAQNTSAAPNAVPGHQLPGADGQALPKSNLATAPTINGHPPTGDKLPAIGKSLSRPNLATVPATTEQPPVNGKQPVTTPAAATPTAKTESPESGKSASQSNANQPAASGVKGASTSPAAIAAPQVPASSSSIKPKPPVSTANVNPAKRLPSTQRAPAPPRPAAVRTPPPSPPARVVQQPKPQVQAQPRPQQQAQHVQAPKPPPRPPAPAKPACHPGKNCKR